MTDVGQLGTGSIVEFAARQNLVRDARDQAVQIARQIFDEAPQPWRGVALSQNRRARGQRLFAQLRQPQNRQRIERQVFHVQACDRLGWIGKLAEGPLHAASPQQNAFGQRCKFTIDSGRVVERRELLDAGAARVGLRVATDERQQLLVFERDECLVVHESVKGYNAARRQTNHACIQCQTWMNSIAIALR